uniref:Uncharacterized protein n=1 Tax=Stegastes partitus TaxID=144197 RepID=A0A3B4ZWY5_9TELE
MFPLVRRPELSATVVSASCRHWHHVASFSCHFDRKRCYWESSESRNSKRSGMFEEESHGMDDDSSDNSSLSRSSSESFHLRVLVSPNRRENAADVCVIKVPQCITSVTAPLHAIKVYKFPKKDGDSNVKIEGKDFGLRSEQLNWIPAETQPEDFMFDGESVKRALGGPSARACSPMITKLAVQPLTPRSVLRQHSEPQVAPNGRQASCKPS